MDFNSWNIIWSLSFGLMAVMITAGNILIIVIFLKRNIRKRPHCQLISLAIADLLVGLLTVPLFITVRVSEEQWIDVFAYINADIFTGLTSIFTIAAISLERMYAIGWPFRHRTLSSRVYIFAIGLPWILAFAVLSLKVLFQLNVISELYSFTIASTISLFAPLVLTCVAYCVIWKKQKSRFPNQLQAARDAKLAKTLLIVTGAFAVTWLPFQIFNTVSYFCQHSCIFPWVGAWYSMKLLQFSNSFVNVVIYPLRIPEFKELLSQMLPTCTHRPHRHHESVVSVTGVSLISLTTIAEDFKPPTDFGFTA